MNKATKKVRVANASPSPTDEQATMLQGVRFLGISTRFSSFQEIPGAKPSIPADQMSSGNVDVELAVTVGAGMTPDGPLAEVTIDATITPEPDRQPYKIRLVVTGAFLAPMDATPDRLDHFCKRAAPVIMFPYMRAIVMMLTQDARFGVLRMDPMNLAAVLEAAGPWQAPAPKKRRKPRPARAAKQR